MRCFEPGFWIQKYLQFFISVAKIAGQVTKNRREKSSSDALLETRRQDLSSIIAALQFRQVTNRVKTSSG
jgi:hypothetical protein